MRFINMDKCGSYEKLSAAAAGCAGFDFKTKLDAERVRNCSVPMAAGLAYNWAAKKADADLVGLLAELADEQELVAKYRAILAGEPMNTGEERCVLHHLLRGEPVPVGGRILTERAFYCRELERFAKFADEVRAGRIRGYSGRRFASVVQIGIGGSDLGPRALYIALENWARKERVPVIEAKFISNVDPDDAAAAVASVNLDETLFVLVSKSGTTQETLANELFIKEKLRAENLEPNRHIVAVTSETSPLAHSPLYLDSFYIDDFIGGRYSSTSAVGGVVLSIAFGPAAFRELLKGAQEADAAALNPDPRSNAALMDALLGIWERNFLGYPCTAVLPYSQGLARFPAHLQQLDMESNGKSANREGESVPYATGPVVFGEPGTNGQHSFYQLLHQGTDIVPLQFIGFEESQLADDILLEGSDNETKLKANLAAQIVAFAKGQGSKDGNKRFDGGRPSSLIHGKRLTPAALGALLAHFENKVMFQGFAWNLNSFDQEGVQLGKKLTKKALDGKSGDDALDAYCALLGI